jgi:hypothetical protein
MSPAFRKVIHRRNPPSSSVTYSLDLWWRSSLGAWWIPLTKVMELLATNFSSCNRHRLSSFGHNPLSKWDAAHPPWEMKRHHTNIPLALSRDHGSSDPILSDVCWRQYLNISWCSRLPWMCVERRLNWYPNFSSVGWYLPFPRWSKK